MERRDFIKTTGLLCGIGGVAAIIGTMDGCAKAASPVNISLDLSTAAYASLNTVGGQVYVNNGSIIIVRVSGSSFSAVDAACTHQGCAVSFNTSINRYLCPCHGGQFDVNGAVVAGPPPSPLNKYTCTVSGNILTVKS